MSIIVGDKKGIKIMFKFGCKICAILILYSGVPKNR